MVESGTREEIEERALPFKVGEEVLVKIDEPHMYNADDAVARVDSYIVSVTGGGARRRAQAGADRGVARSAAVASLPGVEASNGAGGDDGRRRLRARLRRLAHAQSWPQGRSGAFARQPRQQGRVSMYAVVETGGKQYKVEKGTSLLVDRLSAKEGDKVALRPVMFRDKEVVAEPKELEKVKVEATVAEHLRGPKIKVFKYKAEEGLPAPRRPPLRADQARGDRDQMLTRKRLESGPAPKKPRTQNKNPKTRKPRRRRTPMAHKKGLGSSRNGRESNPKMLGVKVFAGQQVAAARSSCASAAPASGPARAPASAATTRSSDAAWIAPARRVAPSSLQDPAQGRPFQAPTFVARSVDREPRRVADTVGSAQAEGGDPVLFYDKAKI